MLAVDLEVGTGGFILLSSVTFLESAVSMRNCHELSHIGLEEFGKLLQLILREKKDVTDFTIHSFNNTAIDVHTHKRVQGPKCEIPQGMWNYTT